MRVVHKLWGVSEESTKPNKVDPREHIREIDLQFASYRGSRGSSLQRWRGG